MLTQLSSHQDPTIVTATVGKDVYDAPVIKYEGKKAGNTKVIVTDGITSYEITVTVTAAPKLSIEYVYVDDDSLSEYIESSKLIKTQIGIGGFFGVKGSGKYEITGNDDSIFTFSYEHSFDDQGAFTYEVLGKSNLTITDKVTGHTINLTFDSE